TCLSSCLLFLAPLVDCFFFQAEDGIRDRNVTGVQTCALPISSYALTGAIVAVYSLTNMVGNVLGGHWIDKYGRKKMLLTGMILVSAILFLYPLAVTGWQLFIARFFHGLA